MSTQAFPLPDKAEQGRLWRELRKDVWDSGLLGKQYPYYARKILLTLCLLGASILCLVAVANFWAQMANAVFLGFVFGQIALLAHDSGHGQIFVSRLWNQRVSIAVGFVVGLSLSWWDEKHNNRHHGNPNNLSFDQDVNVSVLGLTKEQVLGKRGLYRLMVRHQHILFFPTQFLAALSFRGASINYLLCSGSRKQHVKRLALCIDLAGMCAHVAGYILLLAFLLDSWTQIMVFVALHQGFFGLYIGSLFATNHKGMEVLEGDTGRGYLWTQVPTTGNVSNPRWLDWLFDWWFGGLNLQIEHHLFPSMPPNNLRKAREIVKLFCEKHGIPYCETGFFRTYARILGYLRLVSAPLRA